MHTPHVTVLGAGLIGKAIVHDLCHDYAVTAVDHSPAALEALSHQPCGHAALDAFATGALESVAGHADLVVMAMPGAIGHKLLERLVYLGKRVVDISFTEEDPTHLNELAVEHGAVVIPDAGVCPGLSNIVAGYAAAHLFSRLDKYVCYVGGLPREPQGPWFYKNPFAAASVVDEYTRPCRFRIDGQDVVLEPLSDSEEFEFPGVGPLVAFNTDGIRTLLRSLPQVPTLLEKTLRHREHYEFICRLKAAGFLTAARAQEFTEVASPGWKFERGEEDITVMRLLFEGLSKEGAPLRLHFDLLDRYDREARLLSMARTTGYTAAAVARLLLAGGFSEPGVHAPERLGMNGNCYEAILAHLRVRGIEFAQTRV
ncbi:MAG: saccharopine dehydrogenase NADP-binding domain-containing protein [Acidobacteria bacterium]|nr:saccharopine dehydrogenase NADP-binding domain-containing protein [Acidobacteriota bacterium]